MPPLAQAPAYQLGDAKHQLEAEQRMLLGQAQPACYR